MKEYTVISCPDGQECSEINEHLANGWELHGPLIVREWHKDETGFAEFFVWQAMVREIESESKQENPLAEKKKYSAKAHLWSDGRLTGDFEKIFVPGNAKHPYVVETRTIEWEVEG